MKYEILFFFSGSGKIEIEASNFSNAEQLFENKKMELINSASLKGSPKHILAIRQCDYLNDKLILNEDQQPLEIIET